MAKHPSSFKLADGRVFDGITKPMVVHEGSVRELCPLAPNNVNTMAAAAVAANNLGFDQVRGRIIADPRYDQFVLSKRNNSTFLLNVSSVCSIGTSSRSK